MTYLSHADLGGQPGHGRVVPEAEEDDGLVDRGVRDEDALVHSVSNHRRSKLYAVRATGEAGDTADLAYSTRERVGTSSVSYTHLTLPTSDLV